MEGEVRTAGWGGSQLAPVNPSLADPRGDVTEWDNASRCGPDNYGVGMGDGGGGEAWITYRD